MPDKQFEIDKEYLLLSLKLAKKGQQSCRPNPRVGCVLVKNDEIIGQGWHEIAGQAHAEVNAIADAAKRKQSIEGATAYVSLEPCSFTGKTPPCVDALTQAKVKRVVCASLDPNPKVAGQGIENLITNGIEAKVLDDEFVQQQAEWLNRGFFKRMRTGVPWVMLKVASSLDGRTADYQGVSQWISSEKSRQDVHQLRANSCAVLTGSGTQQLDDPSLNVRMEGFDDRFQPYRVLLDTNCQLDSNAKIIGDDQKLIIYTKDSSSSDHSLKESATIIEIDPSNLYTVLESLANRNINQIMIEAGANLAASFLQENLVDEIVQYIAPTVIGSMGRGMFDFSEPIKLSERKQFTVKSVEQLGDDVKIIYVKGG